MVIGAGGGLLSAYYSWRYGPLRKHERTVVTIFSELLAPSDDQSPGANELGVPQEIFDEAANDGRLRRKIRRGVKRLDVLAQAAGSNDFVSLGQQQQLKLIARAEVAEHSTTESIFFRRMRTLTFNYYYGHPETWSSLYYPGPPQPLGFMDYASPPG